jgi:hypothetical protein
MIPDYFIVAHFVPMAALCLQPVLELLAGSSGQFFQKSSAAGKKGSATSELSNNVLFLLKFNVKKFSQKTCHICMNFWH